MASVRAALLCVCWSLLAHSLHALPQKRDGCSTSIPESLRRDCHPEPGSTQARCEARGCLWCPASQQGLPWCFHGTNSVCGMPDSSKTDCYPEPGSSEAGCVARGCLFCPSQSPGVPWCVHDTTGGGGGPGPNPTGGPPVVVPTPGGRPSCPNYSDGEKIDCLPDGGGDPQGECLSRNCFWCESSTAGVPWCFYNKTIFGDDFRDAASRVDCMPGMGGVNAEECAARGCQVGAPVAGAPICYFTDSYGYIVASKASTANGVDVVLTRPANMVQFFSAPFGNIKVTFEYQTDQRLRVKMEDTTAQRFEVPLTITKGSANTPMYSLNISDVGSVFNFQVIRNSDGTVIFDTSLGGLVLEDQFLQFSTKLPSENVYGFGETEHHTFRHDMNWQTYGMYARDQPPAYKGNLYGVHPFYTVLENTGNSHGVLILNSAAQDVTMTPAPGLVYRTIGGILDIYMFLGPTPENVISQYTEAIGRPVMPAYWSLGFQLCRYGYDHIDTMKAAVSRMRQYDIPHDVQYGDIDTMRENLDFTYDPTRFADLPDYVRQLKAEGTRWISILDPCIDSQEPNYAPLTTGNAASVWVTEADGQTPALGKVWPPNAVYFPDYSRPSARTWWIDMCKQFHNDIEFDGLWIDMNEPANFVTGSQKGCTQNSINNPPFMPEIFDRSLLAKTACADYQTHIGNQYDTHSLYGWAETEPTYAAVLASTGKRGIVITRSTFPGSGKYGGHWLGDNYSQWSNLAYSIIGMLEFNLFGIPYIGADICGFNGNTNEEQCQRWMQLGAFYPFSRNHNGKGYTEQDPGYFGDAVAQSTKKALNIRYEFLPYLYTLFFHAHTDGTTVVRPLVHEFPLDLVAKDIDRQFLWGSGFLVSPVLEQSAVTVDAYFPPSSRWYDYYTGAEQSTGQVTLAAPLSHIPIHLRGGVVYPTQGHATTTMVSRTLPFALFVALGTNGEAAGNLFWDDGETIDAYENGNYFYTEFSVTTGSNMGTLKATVAHTAGSPDMPACQTVTVLGLAQQIIGTVQLNGNTVPAASLVYDAGAKKLVISTNIDLKSDWELTWQESSLGNIG